MNKLTFKGARTQFVFAIILFATCPSVLFCQIVNLPVPPSTLTNSQLYYSGPSMTYYCDPGFPISLSTTGSLTASTASAAADSDCSEFSRSESRVAWGITNIEFEPAGSAVGNDVSLQLKSKKQFRNLTLRITDLTGKLIKSVAANANQRVSFSRDIFGSSQFDVAYFYGNQKLISRTFSFSGN